ncbi:hypothetical protein C0W92_03290 [Photobacterium angustum]|uniref:Uncharacterized protein n=1 Tax=Photobacterium angustum TaxID=661 RepID=A0A855SIK2_PHOAN|nr:hypothetical protein C0W92_03290 [Photobacterium angustum]PSX08885.1 hypothetical protein C0W41_04705 [Photobacterium angustum]PSX14248.1 hypothetical protein C0W55_13970 [Photobacterium angustum]PSX23158.1 hypothetical protein C0W36_12500 [Photobacterium angustum]PSX40504.1 hypothetical protein C0W34_13290 [Photobacterium angustum]
MLGTGCSGDNNTYPQNAAPPMLELSLPPPTLLEMAHHQTSDKVCALMGMAREQGNDELVSQLGFLFSSRRDISLRDCIRFADLGQKEERAKKSGELKSSNNKIKRDI